MFMTKVAVPIGMVSMSNRSSSLSVVVLLVLSTLLIGIGPAGSEDRAAGD